MTARMTRSKTAKPVEAEEKHEDNGDSEGSNPVSSFEQRQPTERTDSMTQDRAVEPTSDTPTEPYDDGSDEPREPSEVGVTDLERTMQWLHSAMSKVDMRQGTTSDRVKQLAADLQQLTAKLVTPRVDGASLADNEQPPSQHVEHEDSDTRNLNSSDGRARYLYRSDHEDVAREAATPSHRARRAQEPTRHRRGRPRERRNCSGAAVA
ncbi:hypothetical protein DVH05_002975 [Phytophthora capsici]|nr:hypothetical protein DVH05_002975 [Phytophthora capsici]